MIVYNKMEDRKMEHSEFWNYLYNNYCKDFIRMPRTAWYIGKNISYIPCIPKPSEIFFDKFGINREERWKEYTEELRIIYGKKTKWLVESRNNKNVELGSFIASCINAEDKKELYIKVENCDVKETIQVISMGVRDYPINYDKMSSHIFGIGACLLKAESNCLYFTNDRRSFELCFHEGTTYTILEKESKTTDAKKSDNSDNSNSPSNPDKEN